MVNDQGGSWLILYRSKRTTRCRRCVSRVAKAFGREHTHLARKEALSALACSLRIGVRAIVTARNERGSLRLEAGATR